MKRQVFTLCGLWFGGVDRVATGPPTYRPAIVLKIYLYGYLNKSQSIHQLEHEAEQSVAILDAHRYQKAKKCDPLPGSLFAGFRLGAYRCEWDVLEKQTGIGYRYAGLRVNCFVIICPAPVGAHNECG